MVAINVPQKQSTNDVESGLPLQSQNERTSGYGSYGGAREAQSPESDTPSDHFRTKNSSSDDVHTMVQFSVCLIIMFIIITVLIIYATSSISSSSSSNSSYSHGHGGGYLHHHSASHHSYSHGHYGGGHGHGHHGGGHHG